MNAKGNLKAATKALKTTIRAISFELGALLLKSIIMVRIANPIIRIDIKPHSFRITSEPRMARNNGREIITNEKMNIKSIIDFLLLIPNLFPQTLYYS